MTFLLLRSFFTFEELIHEHNSLTHTHHMMPWIY